MGEMRNAYKILVRKRKIQNCGDVWVDGRIILKGSLKEVVHVRTRLIWLRIGSSNEPSGSIKVGKFLDHLSDYQLLKKDSGPWS